MLSFYSPGGSAEVCDKYTSSYDMIADIAGIYSRDRKPLENFRRTPASLRLQLLKMLERELNDVESDKTVPAW
jgi:hypothetical protein